ncbi:unnamed protein product [Brachionus calyciflorus]|uniref:Cadherin domain-containing protein n=1 Tax=Brachionus calyciflorus TaxID=104777 RepID=A0A813MI88_9BILA|nr:unnamed protein product [Brachionus calyciflorus]
MKILLKILIIYIILNYVTCEIYDIEFTEQNQTILLFEKSNIDIKSYKKIQIVGTIPQKCASFFTLIDNFTNVYLKYHTRTDLSSCIIDLNNGFSFNIDLKTNQLSHTIIDLPELPLLKLNIEYIFKFFNDSAYGLIKTDMNSNGIVSIVRIIYPKNDSIELKLTSHSKFFQIKKFLTNFYMIRLSENFQQLFDEFDTVDLGIEAFLTESKITILNSSLKFKIVNIDDLKINFQSKSLSLNLEEKSHRSGSYLTKITPILKDNLFINLNTSDLKDIYLKNYIRLKIVSNSINENMFDLDPVNGHLSILPGFDIDREKLIEKLKMDKIKIILNISASDSKKIFRQNFLQVSLNLLDVNDNEPIYSRPEYEIELNENNLSEIKTIVLNSKKFYFIFNETAKDLDQGENSSLDYDLISIKSKNKYDFFNLFYVEKLNGKIWISEEIFDLNRTEQFKIFNLEIMCKDNGRPTFKFNFINLNLKIVFKSHDTFNGLNSLEKKSEINGFYFELDLDCLTQIGQITLGKIPLRLKNGFLQIKLENFYERFFNLTLNSDGSLILNLNENYLSNKFSLKSINFLETSIDYLNTESEAKKLKLLINFSNKKNFKFDNENYKFYFDENEVEKLIGNLETNCPNLSEPEIIGENLNKNFKVLKNEKSIEIWNKRPLDRELNEKYEFLVISKCTKDEFEFLMTSKVLILLNDKNDNKPKFINPFRNESTFHKVLSYVDLTQDEDLFISKIEAFDLDKTDIKLKYMLNKISLNSNCQGMFNLRLNLNQVNGELTISNLYTDSIFSHCQFNYDILITTFNQNNSESIKFYIKIDLYGTNLIFQKNFLIQNYSIYKINFTDEYLLDLFYIEQCWINNFEAKDILNTYLDNRIFYFYPKNEFNETSIHYEEIECKLSSTEINTQYLNPWLIVKFKQEEEDMLNETSLNVEILKSTVLSENNFLVNLKNLSESNSQIQIYRFKNSNEKIWIEFFELDSISGDLSTRIISEKISEIIKRINLITLKVEIQYYDKNTTLIRKQDLSVHIRLIEAQTEANEIDKILNEFDSKFLNITINNLNDTSDLAIINFGFKKLENSKEMEISLNFIEQVIFNDNPSDQSEINNNLFKIIESQNQQFLVYNSIYLQPEVNYKNFKLYLLKLKICLKIFNEQNSFVKECSNLSLNVNIVFNLSEEQLIFASDSFNMNFILIDSFLYDQNFKLIRTGSEILDLKNLILGSNLINWNSINLKFKSTNSKCFILNEQNGTLFLNDINNLESSFKIRIDLENSTNQISNLIIYFQVLKLDTVIVKNLSIQYTEEHSWTPILDLEISKINYDIYNRFQMDLICKNLESKQFLRLFKIDRFSGFLTLNENLMSKLKIPMVKIILKIELDNRQVINFDINLHFKFYTNEIKPIIESNLVNFINNTELNHKIFVLNKLKLDNDSYLDLARVKNLNTNNLVLALDYRIKTDKFNNYYIELPYVYSLEQNQLYSFDFVVKFRDTGFLSDRYLTQSLFVVRMNTPNIFSGPKSYINAAGLSQIRINLAEFNDLESPNSEFIQKVFLIDQISSEDKNLIALSKLENDFLELNLTNVENRTELKIKIYKFLMNKLSLEINKVIEYEILVETYDWNIKKPSVYDLVKEFYVDIKILKSDLLKSIRENPYELLIYDFGNFGYLNERNLIEFVIEYFNDLPFEIEKYSGKLYYLVSEDSKDFNLYFEKNYKFKLTATDLNGDSAEIAIDFTLIDDDPISYLGDKLIHTILVTKTIQKNEIIGKIELTNILNQNNYENFTEILNALTNNFWEINYEIISDNNQFEIDTKTGLVVSKDQIEIKDDQFFKICVQVNGKLGRKEMTLLIDVNIIVNLNLPLRYNSKPEFERKLIKFETENTTSYFQLETKKSVNRNSLRFRIIQNIDADCQIDFFTGIIKCLLINVKKVYLTALVFSLDNVNNFDLAKVEISFLNKTRPVVLAISNNQDILKYDLNNSAKIGDSILNVFQLINTTENYFEHLRVFLTESEYDLSSISAYFDLNSLNGDLILKNEIQSNKIILKDSIKLINLDHEQVPKIIKTFRLELNINKSDIFTACSNSISYDSLIQHDSEFIQIGTARDEKLYDSLNYYLEDHEIKKSISKDYNLIITESVIFTNVKDKLISIDSNNGKIFLNRTKFIEQSLTEIQFFVSSFQNKGLMNDFQNIQSRKKCNFKIDFEQNLSHILNHIGLYVLEVDLVIEENKLNIGELIFYAKSYLLKNYKGSYELVSSEKIPFELNSQTGELFLSSNEWSNINFFKFSIKIGSNFLINLRIQILQEIKSIYKRENICLKNSNNSLLKDSKNEILRFEKELYEIELNLDDFSNKNPILKLNVINVPNKKSLNFKILNVNRGLPKFFMSILKLNEKKGDLELEFDNYTKFLNFCERKNSNSLSVVLNIGVEDAYNSDLYGRTLIKIKPNCQMNFINSKFTEPFYLVEISKITKIGSFLTNVKINQKKYDVKYSLCSNNESIVRINNNNGDVYLSKKSDKERYEISICAYVTNKMIVKPIKIETKLIILVQNSITQKQSLSFENQNFNLESSNFSLALGKIDRGNKNLKLLQLNSNSKNKIGVRSENMDFFSFNSSSNWLYADRKSIDKSKKSHFRFKINDLNFQVKFEDDLDLNLFINFNCKPGSKLIDLKSKFKNEYQFLLLVHNEEEEEFLNYNSTDGSIYLLRIPNLKEETEYEFYLKFASSESDFYALKIKVRFVDMQIDDFSKLEFIQRSINNINYYFFNYEYKFYEESQFGFVGSIKQIGNLKIQSEKCLDDSRLVQNVFKITSQNEIRINNEKILNFECDFYSLKIATHNGQEVSVYIKISNYKQIKNFNLTSNFKRSYSTILRTDHSERLFYSINIYDLIKYTRDLDYQLDKAIFLQSNRQIIKEFHLNSENGILTLNFNKNVTNGSFLLNFELILHAKEVFAKKINLNIFVLNGYVTGNELFFDNNVNSVELNDQFSLNLLKYLINPISNLNPRNLRDSGLSLKIENSEPFEFNSMNALITLNQNVKLKFDRLIKVIALDKSTGINQSFKIQVKFNSKLNHSLEEFKKFFKKNKSSILIDSNFKSYSNFILKLKSFGNADKFSNYKTNSDFVKIEPSTGEIKLKNKNNHLSKNDKFYFLIFHNNSIFAEFFVNFVPKSNEFEYKKDLNIEVIRTENQGLTYLGKVTNGDKFKCEQWKFSKSILLEENCDLFLLKNETLKSLNNLQFRVFDEHRKFRSVFYDVKLNTQFLKIQSQKFLIEFKSIKNSISNNEIGYKFYQFLKSKYDFQALDFKTFSSDKTDKVQVFLVTSSDRLENLRQYSKLLEKNYSIKILNIYSSQDSPYEIIKTNSDESKILINTEKLILSVPDNYEIFLNEESIFENSILFKKFSFSQWENLNFSIQNLKTLNLNFKILSEKNNQFLFSSDLGDKNYINCETINGNVRINFNLGKNDQEILIDTKILRGEWFQVEFLFEDYFFISLKKWDSNQKIFTEIDSYKIANFFKINKIKSIYLGGLPINNTNFHNVKNYYSDELEISSFKINNIEFLKCQKDDQNIVGSVHSSLQLKPEYEAFLRSEKILYESRVIESNSFVKGFNMTILFKILNFNLSNPEVLLMRSKNSEIFFNGSKKRIEFYIDNSLIAWIDFLNHLVKSRMEIFIKPGIVKISLDSSIKELSLRDGSDIKNFDIFLTDLNLANQDEIQIEKILINSEDISKFYSNFEYPNQNTLKIGRNKSISNSTDFKLTFADPYFKPGVLLIVILTSILVILIAVLSISFAVLLKKFKKSKKRSPKFVDSKFNSRNPLEISVNSENSPNSSSSSVSDFTNSHSIGRQTIHSIMNNSNNKIENQNCSTLRINKSQQNYFEYDSTTSKSFSSNIFFESILNSKASKSAQIESSTILNTNDLEQLKSFLIWQPEFYHYSSLLNEFEKFSDFNHKCSNKNDLVFMTNSIINTNKDSSNIEEINILGSLNLYDEYDKQTFV